MSQFIVGIPLHLLHGRLTTITIISYIARTATRRWLDHFGWTSSIGGSSTVSRRVLARCSTYDQGRLSRRSISALHYSCTCNKRRDRANGSQSECLTDLRDCWFAQPTNSLRSRSIECSSDKCWKWNMIQNEVINSSWCLNPDGNVMLYTQPYSVADIVEVRSSSSVITPSSYRSSSPSLSESDIPAGLGFIHWNPCHGVSCSGICTWKFDNRQH